MKYGMIKKKIILCGIQFFYDINLMWSQYKIQTYIINLYGKRCLSDNEIMIKNILE